ncbi:Plexin domain-containing protein 2-like [Oopsacas minuta]|uniref:Plexin domain-containing protein 2-like n=1 Tax=Oopsacas minuta TaxID=111878 RepID=A0AAV7K301_9METZ|nr:Plexin domain-containing protein 2-like [Oopsacas minuta]
MLFILIEYAFFISSSFILVALLIPELVIELREQRRGVITSGDQLRTIYMSLISGASKLLTPKTAVTILTAGESIRESDDESVDLEKQQIQVGDPFRYRRDQNESTETPTPVMVADHVYYESNFYTGNKFDELWLDISVNNNSYHSPLSTGYYLYDPIDLKFNFPFYGHYIYSIAITTHGFLSTADLLHPNIYLTQYIAPFSADFNPSLSQSSRIHYYSSADLFIAQWSNVSVVTKRSAGGFTFQVQLRPSGQITFVYKTVPLTIRQASKSSYESFYGLADGFILKIEGNLYLYSYHNVSLPLDRNLTHSVYILKPLENCIIAGDRQACNATSCTTEFECGWCDTLQRCSDGIDRRRQDWYTAECNHDATLYCVAQPEQGISTVVIVAIILLVLFLILTPISIPIVIVMVWGIHRYRKGRLSWAPGYVSADEELVTHKSDQVILREAEDAI